MFLFKKVKKNIMDAMLGFAAGIMIAASFFSLLEPSLKMAESLKMIPWIVTTIGFISGGLLLFIGDRIFTKIDKKISKNKDENNKTKSLKRCIMLILSITLHNIPEGLAVGVAFGGIAYGIEGATLSSALMIALGIGIQNFPEGTAVSVPLRREGLSRKKGNFKVQNVDAIGDKDELLKIAAYAESFSNHPIARSIIESYGKEINKQDIKEYEEISGHGVSAIIEGKKVLLGNSKLMKKIGITVKEENNSATVVYIAIDEKYAGKIEIADELKEDSKVAIENLKKQGIKKTVMLTGDREKVGKDVAEKLGIDEVYTELLPTGKVDELQKLLNNKKGNVAFIGDGLNDAPVLAMADVGIAMGGYGTDAAIEAADVVIMTDEPSKICEAIKTAKKTIKISKENITFAIAVKLTVLLLVFLGVATMWQAVFADVGVTVIATLNALRTLKK